MTLTRRTAGMVVLDPTLGVARGTGSWATGANKPRATLPPPQLPGLPAPTQTLPSGTEETDMLASGRELAVAVAVDQRVCHCQALPQNCFRLWEARARLPCCREQRAWLWGDPERRSRRLCQQVLPSPRLCCLDPSSSVSWRKTQGWKCLLLKVKLLLAEDDQYQQRRARGLGERRALHQWVNVDFPFVTIVNSFSDSIRTTQWFLCYQVSWRVVSAMGTWARKGGVNAIAWQTAAPGATLTTTHSASTPSQATTVNPTDGPARLASTMLERVITAWCNLCLLFQVSGR